MIKQSKKWAIQDRRAPKAAQRREFVAYRMVGRIVHTAVTPLERDLPEVGRPTARGPLTTVRFVTGAKK